MNINRRSLLTAVAAGAAGAVSTTAIAKPVFVKVGSPAMSVPPDVMAAIKEWQAANAEKKVALDAYSGPNAPKYHLPIDHPLRSAWIDADDAATQAQFKLLRLLEQYAA